MMIKRFIAVGISLIIILMCPFASAVDDPVHWRNQADHSRWTNAMVFGNEFYASVKPIGIRTAVEQLDDALLLCIDQYNGFYADKLQKLNDAKISGIPASISEIDFAAGTDHRTYTHRGWNHTYAQFEISHGHADVRKSLLKAVVNHVFQFSRHMASAEVAEKKCDAMCCLLYVTHIIGDRYHSSAYYGAASTLLLADDSESVIHDLEQCLPTLLSESNYSSLVNKLKMLSSEIKSKRHKVNTNDELLMIDREYAQMLMKLLKSSLYDLLQEQSWFSAAFSPEWSCN